MGSGHFLVEATVFLADHIVYHPTTRPATEQVVTKGDRRRTAEEITKAGRIPVPEGESQEQAEIACWRRRVVEGCIYGVDLNPLAVDGPIALRGANVGRYIFNDEPKQGEPKYLFADRFLKAHGPNTKAFDHQFVRIGYQRGAAIDNWRRIIATIIEEESFCSMCSAI